MRLILTLILLNLFSFSIKANSIKGIVLDQKTKKPISFVSIGIIDTPYGTYSSETGQFELKLSEIKASDSLRFSCVGYYPETFSINDYKNRFKSELDTIVLREKTFELEEVLILNNNKYHKKKIGNRTSTQQLILGFFGDLERGIIIENDEKLFLNKVSFKLTMSGGQVPDSAIFRFNIYNLKDCLPNENILKEPIYFFIDNDHFYGKNEFDISKYNIVIKESFGATFELVKQYGGNRIYFAAWYKGNQSIQRKGTQGSWIDSKTDKNGMKLYQSLEIEALIEENEK